jgi:hypothetical protein
VRIQYAQLTAAKVSNPRFREKCGNSPDISRGISQLGMCKFESSEVSQAVRQSERTPLILAESPANGGLLRISNQSPGSDFGHSQREIADSLQRAFEKLPFSGGCAWRQGFDLHCAAGLAMQSAILLPGRRQIWNFESDLRRGAAYVGWPSAESASVDRRSTVNPSATL